MTSPAEPQVYLNGQFLPLARASISIFDAGITLGATITDLTRTFRHQPFRLDDHIERFYASAKYARIAPPVSRDETRAIAEEVVARNAALLAADQDLALVQFLTPGEVGMYAGRPGRAGDADPTYCMHTFPLPFAHWRAYFSEGAHVVTPSVRQVPPQCWDPKMKCRSRIHWWLADHEARLADPKAVALCLDLDGNVTETSTANFLIVAGGAVSSPTPRNILWGVSLMTVQELCVELDIPFHVRDVQVHDAVNADEALLASTTYCLAPVTRINGIAIGEGRPGPIFRRLIDAWSARVGLDIVAQITRAS